MSLVAFPALAFVVAKFGPAVGDQLVRRVVVRLVRNR